MHAERSEWSAEDGAPNDLFSIGEMARSFNVTLRTLRFYEIRGLIKPIRNRASRYYDAAARSRLELILRGKQLGFTLLEIQEMLAARTQEPMPSFEFALGENQVLAQLELLQRQRSTIERAIVDLKATLEKLAAPSRNLQPLLPQEAPRLSLSAG